MDHLSVIVRENNDQFVSILHSYFFAINFG